jgi:hypothetical protein
MANQAIALQARAPQGDPLGGAIRGNAQMINMMAQQQAAQRQNAIAEQTMQIQRQREARETAMAGPQLAEAQSKAGSAQVKLVTDFYNASAVSLANARNAEDAVAVGTRLKQFFPEPAFQQVVDQTLASIPQDPAQFSAWRQTTLARTMDAKEQLARDFTSQNLGTSTRVIATPKFAGVEGGATVVPGSQAEVAFKPTVVNVEGVGAVIVDPNTGQGFPAAAGETGGFRRPPTGGGIPAGRGGGADTIYGGGKYGSPTTPLSSMTVGQVQDYQRDSLIPATRGKVGKGPRIGTGAVGTYQLSYGTLKDYAPKVLGDNWRNTPFTADAQERVARAIYEDVKGGNLKDTWDGLPANKPGAYSNVPWEQVRGKIARVESGGAPPAQVKTIDEVATQKAFGKILPIIGYDPKTGKNRVSQLISQSTSGGAEMLGSELVGFFGEATPGRKALSELNAIAENMTFEKLKGKLGAQISDADVRLIARTMADIANGNTPANARAAAWNSVVLPLLLRGAGLGDAAAAGGDIPTLTPEQARANPNIKRFRTTDGRVIRR